jgi:hypothetical protein
MDEYANKATGYYDDAMEIGADGEPVPTEVITRTPEENELAYKWMEKLLDPNSPLSKRAQQEGKDFAASRGLMNSSITGGNAYGAWIDRVQPYAMDASGVYNRAATDNMAAQNVGKLTDSQHRQQLRAQREADLRGYNLGAATDYNRAGLNVENREDSQAHDTSERLGSQGWQTGEREASQGWQTGERTSTQGWQSGENAADRTHQGSMQDDQQTWQSGESAADRAQRLLEQENDQDWRTDERTDTENWTDDQRKASEKFQWDRDQLSAQMEMAGLAQQERSIILQAWTNLATGRASSLAEVIAQIQSNPNLTPAQAKSATDNAVALLGPLFPTEPPYGAPPAPGAYQPTPYDPYPTTPSGSKPSASGPAYDASGKPLFDTGLM